ncbi:MAG TPA: FHA domain-containing protein [Kofleriaceae bacterium]|nr:FHA domain-containing protein [Kofleriaceae bacterium]
MFKLVIQDDEGKTTVVPLIRDEITIGRKEGNTIRLTERNVSRRHARILRNNGEVHIEDLGSYNGIRVNNARIAERVSLRVSDQVQIGDYKLFLKAEGLEQAAAQTDGNGMPAPLERTEPDVIRTQGPAMAATAPLPPTEAMPVATPAATGPHPAIAATAPQIVGSPNRTMVALPDDGARTIGPATQEALDALKRTTGYGKLVVLSSNFAGKEFELSRPQMIIGRTDENDIVINHRSISRNHAKVVREPETSRYTISDLQSSNGVRVNGQDYGKVELRRGDVVDLGHVRLRFVDAGEDFVFARDAVITDVPEAGGKRGMLMAVIAAVLVVAAGLVVYMMRSGGDKPSKEGTATPGSASGATDVAAAPPTPDAAVDEANGAAHPAVATTDHAVSPDGQAGKKHNECVELRAAKKWQDLLDCGKALTQLGGAKGDEFQKVAQAETKNERVAHDINTKIGNGALRDAQAALKAFPSDSVYFHDLNESFEKADLANVKEESRKAAAHLASHNCDALKRLQAQEAAGSTGTERAVAAVSTALAKCNAEKAAAQQAAEPTHPKPGPGSAAVATNPGTTPTPTPPQPKCDPAAVDDWTTQAANQFSSGYAQAALQLVLKAINCKPDVRLYRFAATYACAAHDSAAAKLYFNKVPTAYQAPIQQKCQQEHTDLGITQP